MIRSEVLAVISEAGNLSAPSIDLDQACKTLLDGNDSKLLLDALRIAYFCGARDARAVSIERYQDAIVGCNDRIKFFVG